MAATARTQGVANEGEVVRFDTHQRIQHILMMVSFIILALTGLPLKFNNLDISQWWISLLGGIDTTRWLHRLAAWVMVIDAVYHLGYVFFSTFIRKKPFPFWMIPSLKDVLDFVQDVRYYTGLRPERSKFGRFTYQEKFDYWAVFWGVPIMAVSGLILMYPVLATRFLPGQVVPIALVAHSDEAILAAGWIFIVHIFFVHLVPAVFPLNRSIFTGRVPKKRYQEEHPLDYQRMEEERQAEASEPKVSTD